MTKFDLSLKGPRLCWDAESPQVKPWRSGEGSHATCLHFCDSSLTFLETEIAFHLEMRTKGRFHISRVWKWKFNLKIVIDEKSVLPMSFGLCSH